MIKPYSKYKDSGLRWIDTIPEDWKTVFINRICSIGRGRVISEEELKSGELALYPVYSSQTLNDGVFGFLDTYDFEGDYATWTTDGANAGTVFRRSGKFSCTNVCGTLKPNSNKPLIELQYLTYVLNFATKPEVRQDINPKLMNNMMAATKICLPSFEEQTQIVKYLDYKTGLIDDFIASRKKQIDLLREQLHFKINEALTKGINENVNFKPTDIKYVPEIPEHWDIRKFKGLTTILTCGYASTPEYVEESEGVAFLSAQNCRPFRMDLSKYSFIKPELHKQLTRYKKPQRGDVLVTRVGAGIGEACIIDTDLEFSVYVSLTHIRPNKEILSEYIVYFFNTEYCYQLNHEGTVVGGGQGNLNVKNVERYRIPLPPIDEQKEIVAFSDNYRSETDELISKYQKQIELMQEYRTAIISQAVTGKIDVRDWQPKANVKNEI